MKNLLLFIVFLFGSLGITAQEDSTYLDFGGIIYLDSLVVTASRSGFDVKDFIEIVEEDESFYTAFKNIRFLSYRSNNDIKLFDKKGKEIASYKSMIEQTSDGSCRTMKTFDEVTTGKFYKNKKKKNYKYYTAKMYDRLFFTHKKVCENRNAKQKPPKNKMEEYIQELKTLIFKPGEETNIPIIGSKTAIFDKDMVKYYDYSITSKSYDGNIDCYVFAAKVKDEFLTKKVGKTVIKNLETFFDKETFQVIARNYQLQYAGALFDFDVSMKIKLSKLGEQYVPVFIHYDGQWDVPAKKPEISTFTIDFFDYRS